MLTAKRGWKFIMEDYDQDRANELYKSKDWMIVYDRDEAKKMLEYFADSEKYRKDPFDWRRVTEMSDDRMLLRYESVKQDGYGCAKKYVEIKAKLINIVEEGS